MVKLTSSQAPGLGPILAKENQTTFSRTPLTDSWLNDLRTNLAGNSYLDTLCSKPNLIVVPTAKQIKSGSNIEAIRSGEQEIIPSESKAKFDKTVKAVQIRINQLNHNPETDKNISEDGKFGLKTATAIEEIRKSLKLPASKNIDKNLIEALFPEVNLANFEKGLIEISRKSTGPAYKELIQATQEKLNIILKSDIPAEGKFGAQTELALNQVKAALGLPQNGIVDRDTISRINALLKDPQRIQQVQEYIAKLDQFEQLGVMLPKDMASSLYHKMKGISEDKSNPGLGLEKLLTENKIDISTAQGISAFQTSRGINASGQLNPETAKHLNEVLSASWCKKLVLDHNYSWKTETNQLNMLGLRGWDRENGQTANQANKWNDTIAMAWKDDKGLIRYKEFQATTDPGLKNNSKAPDVDDDGCGDVGHIKPGQYDFKIGYYKGRYGFGVPIKDGEVAVFRDTNHDGRISADDGVIPKRNQVERLLDRVKSYFGDDTFKLHPVNSKSSPDSFTEVNGFSAGCQVPKISMSQFKKEITPILEANPGTFPYSLIDMSSNHGFNSEMAALIAHARGVEQN